LKEAPSPAQQRPGVALLVGLSCSDKFYFSTLNQMIKIMHIFSNHQKAGMQKCFVSGAGLVA